MSKILRHATIFGKIVFKKEKVTLHFDNRLDIETCICCNFSYIWMKNCIKISFHICKKKTDQLNYSLKTCFEWQSMFLQICQSIMTQFFIQIRKIIGVFFHIWSHLSKEVFLGSKERCLYFVSNINCICNCEWGLQHYKHM